MVTRAALEKSPVTNSDLRYNPIASRGSASALLLTIHRCPEMGPPVAAKDARSFNGIAYSISPSRKGNLYGQCQISPRPPL